MHSKQELYKEKIKSNLKESYKHLERLEIAFNELLKNCSFPIKESFLQDILNNNNLLAFSDQVIYRFSKLQDSMGAKLFKSLLLYQGENVDKPFLDILNRLEKMDIVNVEEWFEIRDLRNEIAHDYNDNEENIINILNRIYEVKYDLKKILDAINSLLKSENETA